VAQGGKDGRKVMVGELVHSLPLKADNEGEALALYARYLHNSATIRCR
jgi:hypothetical protein